MDSAPPSERPYGEAVEVAVGPNSSNSWDRPEPTEQELAKWWAQRHGLPLTNTGRVPRSVLTLYRAKLNPDEQFLLAEIATHGRRWRDKTGQIRTVLCESGNWQRTRLDRLLCKLRDKGLLSYEARPGRGTTLITLLVDPGMALRLKPPP